MTPYEQEMEDLALRLTVRKRFDSAMPNQPTSDDDENQDQPAKRRR